MVNGKVTDHRAVRDDLGLLLQLDVLAPPAPALAVSREGDVTVERNKDVASRFVETIFNQKRTEALAEFMLPDVVLHHSSRTLTPGLEGIKQHHQQLFLGLSDLHYEIEDLVAAGDRVILRLTISGTHQGNYWGFEPTGKRVTMTAIDVLRLVDGKIAEIWTESDALGMREQLDGHTPSEGTRP